MKGLRESSALVLNVHPGPVALAALLALVANSAAAPDDEACATSGVSEAWGGWGHEDCGATAPVCSENVTCGTSAYQESGSVWVSYCGCAGSGGEPECCHMVLRSRDGGPFLPFAEGKCAAQMTGCAPGNTCGFRASGSSRDAECTAEPLPM